MITYRGDGTDRCPGCNRRQFHIGRALAECAFCGTAIPLVQSANHGACQIIRTVRRASVESL